MKRRVCWLSTQRGPTLNFLLFAFAPQRSKRLLKLLCCYIYRFSLLIFFPIPSPFSPEQEKVDVAQKRDVEGMGIPEIKYGESMCFVQHVSTGLWLTYAALDAKAARLGMMKRKV